jgi:hypothetical protein
MIKLTGNREIALGQTGSGWPTVKTRRMTRFFRRHPINMEAARAFQGAIFGDRRPAFAASTLLPL